MNIDHRASIIANGMEAMSKITDPGEPITEVGKQKIADVSAAFLAIWDSLMPIIISDILAAIRQNKIIVDSKKS